MCDRCARADAVRVWVIEDDSEVAAYIGKAFGELGVNVGLCGEGRDGLLMASTEDYLAKPFAFSELHARIESLMTTVQEVSNNVAHDLRKPLTRLRHSLEEAQGAVAEAAAFALEKASCEADELISTFNALLRIARVEVILNRAS